MDAREGAGEGTVLLGVVVAGAAVVGLSIVVGYVGPKPGFQWELASIFGTALGTTLLALATGALAYSTWSDVRATWRLAELTKHDQDERERPVVLQEEAVYEGGGEQGGRQEGWLNVELRNVGLGPALRVEVRATYWDDRYEPTISPNPSILPAIAPGETKPFRMFVRFEEKSRLKGSDLTASPSAAPSPIARSRGATTSSRAGRTSRASALSSGDAALSVQVRGSVSPGRCAGRVGSDAGGRIQ